MGVRNFGWRVGTIQTQDIVGIVEIAIIVSVHLAYPPTLTLHTHDTVPFP